MSKRLKIQLLSGFTGHDESFCQAAARKNRDVSRKRRDRVIFHSWEHEHLVDVVRNDRKAETLSQSDDVEQMFLAENVSAWISNVVDENRSSVGVDFCFHVDEVAVPLVLRVQVVRASLDLVAIQPGLVVEARFRDQNVVARVGQCQETHFKSARSSAHKADVVT